MSFLVFAEIKLFGEGYAEVSFDLLFVFFDGNLCLKQRFVHFNRVLLAVLFRPVAVGQSVFASVAALSRFTILSYFGLIFGEAFDERPS